MVTRAPVHYAVIHSREAPELRRGRGVWPWTTGVVALMALATGTVLILAIEWAIVAPSPAVQAAEARHRTELRHSKFRLEAQTRLGTLNRQLAELGEAIRELETTLRDKLGLTGNGVKYEDFETPTELDRLMATEEAGASDAWDKIESALLVRPTLERLTREAAGFSGQEVFEASDITSLNTAVGESKTALEQVNAGQDTANHLAVLLQTEQLRSHLPTRKEP